MTDLIAYVFDDLILTDLSIEQKSQVAGLVGEIQRERERKGEHG